MPERPIAVGHPYGADTRADVDLRDDQDFGERADAFRNEEQNPWDTSGQRPTNELEPGAMKVEVVDVVRVEPFGSESVHIFRLPVGAAGSDTNRAQQIVNRDTKRRDVTVCNLGPGVVEIGENPALQPGNGLPLAAPSVTNTVGGSWTFNTRAPLYAIMQTAGTQCSVQVVTENEDG